MDIKTKTEHDPVADIAMMDAYMHWALMSAEEVTGKHGLQIVLREVGLERLIDSYPPNEMTLSYNLTAGDYASLHAGLVNFFGRAGKSMLLRVGRQGSHFGLEQQGAWFNMASVVTMKLLPYPAQVKMILGNIQGGFIKIFEQFGQDMRLYLHELGDKYLYVAETCPMCAGKAASKPMCQSFTGTLEESIRVLTGKEADVEEIACRATGAPACVWAVGKKPR